MSLLTMLLRTLCSTDLVAPVSTGEFRGDRVQAQASGPSSTKVSPWVHYGAHPAAPVLPAPCLPS